MALASDRRNGGEVDQVREECEIGFWANALQTQKVSSKGTSLKCLIIYGFGRISDSAYLGGGRGGGLSTDLATKIQSWLVKNKTTEDAEDIRYL